MAHRERRGCTGKIRYRDEIAARLALATLYRADKPGHGECRAYRCPHCRGWHLTSKPRGKFKADT